MEVSGQIEILKRNFNNYSETLVSFLSKIAPRSSIIMYKPYIEKLCKANSNKIIDTFVINGLIHEEKIMREDEEYFMGMSVSEKDDSDKLRKIFQFKNVWKTLSSEDKHTIKSYMKLLCVIARKYFDLLYN